MPSAPRRTVEVETHEELDRLLARGGRSMAGWQLQGLDLRGHAEALAGLDPRGALLLGCTLDPADEARLREGGALVVPDVPDVPFDVHRSGLYTPAELYDGLAGGSYEVTLDARVYAWTTASGSAGHGGHEGGRTVVLRDELARTLHDLAIDDALGDLLGDPVDGPRPPGGPVGVMGGHATLRGSADYVAAVRLGRSLAASGLVVATGGGPGAMEAANLGAYLAGHDDAVLDEALSVLSGVPDFRPSIGAWAGAAFEVRTRWPGDETSLGVPTWFYGHEPPNAFAGRIAKYFRNAVREDVLLHVCTAGVVFLPGRAGTVQEVFQDACENYYAGAAAAPMVLVGVDYWTRELPVWPLLEALAAEREMAHVVHLVDDVAEVAGLLAGPG